MTSKLQIPPTLKDRKMADGIKGLVGKKITKELKFMGETVKISKLNVSDVLEIQELAKNTNLEANGLDLVKRVIRLSVADANDLSDEDFDTFPMDELSKLSNEIMMFSGLGNDPKSKQS